LQQSNWTLEARSFILNSLKLPQNPKLLEIGSGTGVILKQMENLTGHKCVGLDINWKNIKYNKENNPNQDLLLADGHFTPLRPNSFDLVFCHYLLLWIKDPTVLLREMRRITKIQGWICCFAEPDYIARIDFPKMVQQIGQKQNIALREQLVRLDTGRQVANWMRESGLINVHWGILGSHQTLRKGSGEIQTELDVLINDLKMTYSKEEIEILLSDYSRNLINEGSISFIPTFYAYAQNA
jgi:SAM-dependent methyltransferase